MERIVEKSKEVNSFIDFVNKEIEKDLKEGLSRKALKKQDKYYLLENGPLRDFFRLVPKANRSGVLWKIEKQFNNNANAYVKKHKLFAVKFTEKLRDTANDTIATNERDKKKKKKEAMLYSSQLLGLVGKNGSAYINDSLLEYYKKDFEDQENYLKNFKLIRSDGAITNLTTIEDKQKRKVAQILNLSSCMDLMAKDKGFTYSLITLTLPPSKHPSPVKGANSFDGTMPLEAHKQLHQYWRLIRANMAKAGLRAKTSYFGIEVLEAHKDSTLHLHILIYTSKADQALIKNIVAGVANRSHEFVKFDFKESNGKAGGSTYVFKYLTKTNAVYNDSNAQKNTAVRWYYSARGFNFFGIDSSLSKFNFLIQNKEDYKNFFCEDLYKCLKNYDYYTFIHKYSSYFKIIREKSKISFVIYNLDGNNQEFLKKSSSLLPSQYIAIKKRIYNVFEVNSNVDDNTRNISHLDKNDLINAPIFRAFDIVKKETREYSKTIKDYIHSSKLTFVRNIEDVNFEDVSDLEVKEFCPFDDYINKDDSFGYAGDFGCEYSNEFISLVTVKPSYSSEKIKTKELSVKDRIKRSRDRTKDEKSRTLEENNKYNLLLKQEFDDFLRNG